MPNSENANALSCKQLPKPNITDFITQNEKLLTALGIFTALTLFGASLPLKGLGAVISLMFFALALLTAYELWGKFPSDGTGSLAHFENFLMGAIGLMGLYFLIELNHYLPVAMFFVVFTVITYPTSIYIKKYDTFNRIARTQPGGKRTLRYILATAILLTALGLSLYTSIIITPIIKNFFDEGYKMSSNPYLFEQSLNNKRSTQTQPTSDSNKAKGAIAK